MSDFRNLQSNLLRQYPLALKFERETTFNNFWPEKNLELISSVKNIIDSSSGGWLYLAGVNGSGVSHLLQAVSNYAQEQGKTTLYFSLAEMLLAVVGGEESNDCYQFQSLFESLENFDILCIDDIDCLADMSKWQVSLQEQLFYFLVRLQQLPVSRLVFGAKNVVSQLNLSLADLSSRLALATVFQLNVMDDDIKQKILQFRADRLGLSMSNEVAKFMVQRCSRDMHELIKKLDQLDIQALAESRKLTIPLVKKVFSI